MGLDFQIHQICRTLERYGQQCSFSREIENKFHEKAWEEGTAKCRGLFHEANGFLNVSLVEAGKIRTQKEPKLLVRYTKDINKNDKVAVGEVVYKVIGIDDLGSLHLCLDLSLEAV
ncbi:head-tail adaptor protein [Blautia pseudococcoides]|uniref:head-tail adaptor protein n=1 Tax=Blautia pseudococcoides TaxID=1796616 RepID=UPI00148B33AB|nr:head-tail adaptor protein [Blautia pseudococcoides]QJU14788.1 head-tail adaptor protein [Blautia pseudococcoides]